MHRRDKIEDGCIVQDIHKQKGYWSNLWSKKYKMNIRRHKFVYNLVKPYLYGQIVDLGNGVTNLYNGGGYSVVGIDISEEAQNRMAKMFPFGEWLVGDIKNTGLPDNCADTVLLLNVIEHFSDYSAVLKEAVRICKGVIITVLPVEHYDKDHRHPIWNEEDVKSLGIHLGDIQYKRYGKYWFVTTGEIYDD